MKEVPLFKFALREDLKDEKIFLPTKGEPLATGYDCRAAPSDRKDIVLQPGQYGKIPLGFRCICPPGWWFKLVPRSSTFIKKSLHALYGTIDETYEGEAMFLCDYLPDIKSLSNDLVIKFGEAIGQIIPVKRIEMGIELISNNEYDHLCEERNGQRKTGGFGSTSVGFYKTGGDK